MTDIKFSAISYLKSKEISNDKQLTIYCVDPICSKFSDGKYYFEVKIINNIYDVNQNEIITITNWNFKIELFSDHKINFFIEAFYYKKEKNSTSIKTDLLQSLSEDIEIKNLLKFERRKLLQEECSKFYNFPIEFFPLISYNNLKDSVNYVSSCEKKEINEIYEKTNNIYLFIEKPLNFSEEKILREPCELKNKIIKKLKMSPKKQLPTDLKKINNGIETIDNSLNYDLFTTKESLIKYNNSQNNLIDFNLIKEDHNQIDDSFITDNNKKSINLNENKIDTIDNNMISILSKYSDINKSDKNKEVELKNKYHKIIEIEDDKNCDSFIIDNKIVEINKKEYKEIDKINNILINDDSINLIYDKTENETKTDEFITNIYNDIIKTKDATNFKNKKNYNAINNNENLFLSNNLNNEEDNNIEKEHVEIQSSSDISFYEVKKKKKKSLNDIIYEMGVLYQSPNAFICKIHKNEVKSNEINFKNNTIQFLKSKLTHKKEIINIDSE